MKVLHLSKYYSPYKGGVEQVVEDLCIGTKSELDEVAVLCVNHERGSRVSKVDDITIYRAHSNLKIASTDFSITYIRVLSSIISTFDLIHVHLPNPLANLAMLIAGVKREQKVVVHWHSDIVKQKKLKVLYKPFEKWLLNRSNSIVATSPYYANCSDVLPKYKEKLQVIPIGLDSTKLQWSQHEVEKIRQNFVGRKIVFSLGRMVYYKGFQYLIEAAENLGDEYVFLIGGTGELFNEYSRLVRKKKLDQKVILLGNVPSENLGSLFKAADVFCMPSCERSEAFGVVQLEAFSVGTPVVSCKIQGSGVSWVNQSGVTGITVEPKNSVELAKAIEQACKSSLVYGAAATNRFKELFSRAKMARMTLDLYKKLNRN